MEEISALVTDGRIGPAIAATGLASARLYALTRSVPFLGGRRVPATLHLGLAVALGIAAGPGRLDSVPAAPLLAMLAIKEVLVGFSAGFVASLPFHFLEQSGAVADAARTTSFSPAPVGGTSGSSPAGNLVLLLATCVFFLTPAHAAFWTGVEATFRAVPLAPSPLALPSWQSIAMAAIASSSALLAASIMIAFPVLASVLIADLAVGAAGRFVPHAGGTLSFMPLRSAVGLGALALALTALLPVAARLLLDSMSWLEAVR